MKAITAIVLTVTLAASMALAQTPPASANPELVGELAKGLGSTPQQAEGAAGAIFGLAKSRLKPADFAQVSGAVPGMDGLLKAAPALGGASGLGGVAGMASMASLAGSFSKLGLKPDMVAKAIPIVTQYVTKSGGAGVGSLLAGVLK